MTQDERLCTCCGDRNATVVMTEGGTGFKAYRCEACADEYHHVVDERTGVCSGMLGMGWMALP